MKIKPTYYYFLFFAVLLSTSFAAYSVQPTRSNTGNQQLDLVNDGYSLLYANVSGLKVVDKIFYVKIADKQTKEVVDNISTYSGELKTQLDQLKQRYPELRLDLDPLPEVEKAKQSAAQTQRVLSFTPIVGRTGENFERTLLLTLSGGLNQLRFLCKVIAEEETNDQRKSEMLGVSKRFTELYASTLKLLNENYYKDNTFDASEYK